jgi:hypothetical protein
MLSELGHPALFGRDGLQTAGDGEAQCHVDKRVRGFEVAVALTEGGCWVFNGE